MDTRVKPAYDTTLLPALRCTAKRRCTASGTRSLRQRAAALGRGRERLVAPHQGELLVVIPGFLGLRRFLDLEQIEVVHKASVRQHLALGKQIVDRKLLQLR